MKKAIKGALLSGLVLPGLGQMVLKRYVRGVAILLASLACLGFLVAQAVEAANTVIAKIDLLNAAIDPAALLAEITETTGASGANFEVASWLLLFLWLGGTVDAWLLGRKQDREVPDVREGGRSF